MKKTNEATTTEGQELEERDKLAADLAFLLVSAHRHDQALIACKQKSDAETPKFSTKTRQDT